MQLLIEIGVKNQEKFLSTHGVGLCDSIMTKFAKMLFEFQFKYEMQM